MPGVPHRRLPGCEPHLAWRLTSFSSGGETAMRYLTVAHTPGSPTRSFAAPACGQLTSVYSVAIAAVPGTCISAPSTQSSHVCDGWCSAESVQIKRPVMIRVRMGSACQAEKHQIATPAHEQGFAPVGGTGSSSGACESVRNTSSAASCCPRPCSQVKDLTNEPIHTTDLSSIPHDADMPSRQHALALKPFCAVPICGPVMLSSALGTIQHQSYVARHAWSSATISE